MSQPIKDRSHWPQAKFSRLEKARAHRINPWQEAGCAARFTAAWELVTECWRGLKGKHPDELRLQTSFTKAILATQTADRP